MNELSTSDKIALLSLVVGSVLAIVLAVIPMIRESRSRKRAKPELTVEIKSEGANRFSRQIGVSRNPNNVPMVPMDDGSGRMAIDGNNAWREYEMTFGMLLVIRNNSEHTAYYPKLHFLTNEHFGFEDKLDYTKPIQSGEEVTLKCVYVTLEDCHPSKRTDISKTAFPPDLNNMRLLLEYQNASKYKFYTEYNQATKSYRFLNKIP